MLLAKLCVTYSSLKLIEQFILVHYLKLYKPLDNLITYATLVENFWGLDCPGKPRVAGTFLFLFLRKRVVCTSVGRLGLNKFGAIPIGILKAVMMGACASPECF